MYLQDMTPGMEIIAERDVLPARVKPLHYALTLEPDLNDFTFQGTVIIDLDVKEDTNSITLNVIDLESLEVTLDRLGHTVIGDDKPLDVHFDTAKERATAYTPHRLYAGSKAKLTATFRGHLKDDLRGFYRSAYTSSDGVKKYIAASQTCPTDARRVFPCFDEPALKATFDLTLIAEQHLTCLSNMDVKSEKALEGGPTTKKSKAVVFNTTPPMSTYLLAFVVGELNYIESTAFRIPIRVYAPPDQNIESGRFALDLCVKTLPFYEKNFGSEYPLPKMDQVALPDFAAGAMENWGLITYRTTLLLFDEEISGAATKQRIATIVVHELAHQWFGNLVTMDWWDGLWLNESFATWVAWFACDHFFPEWKVWEGYINDTFKQALALDGLRSSHPIEIPITRGEDANQLLDAITYQKGSSVLRMISKYIGIDAFLAGVRLYLKEHAYGNSKTTDLWQALSHISGRDIENVMATWTKKIGYPVLKVEEDEASNTITVTQHRFLRSGDVRPEDDETLFPVSLSVLTEDGVNEDMTLPGRSSTFTLKTLDFYKLNTRHAGLYRTLYTADRLKSLGVTVATSNILSVEDRAGMIADAGALSSAGYQSSSITLSLLKTLSQEQDYVVWNEIISWLTSIRQAFIFGASEIQIGLKSFVLQMTSDKAHELGCTFSTEDSLILQQFKALMFETAGLAGDEKVVSAATEMFKRFACGDGSAIHPNIRDGVYRIVLSHADIPAAYETLLHEFRTTKYDDARITALRALGHAKSTDLIRRTIELALSSEVRTQDLMYALQGLRAHAQGIEALWDMLKSNYETLEKKIPTSQGARGRIVETCISALTSREKVEEVRVFFEGKETVDFEKVLKQALEEVEASGRWVEKDRRDIMEWLRREGYCS